MKLYNFAWGPYPRRIAIYLAEKEIDGIERIEVEFPHRPELWPNGFLLALNPAHSLPVLDTGTGYLIGQSIAALEYLEECCPGPDMIGPTPEVRAATREMTAIFDEAASFFGIWARQGSALNADRHTRSLAAAAVGAERYLSKLRIAEAKIVGPFLGGETMTIADCVALALIEFAADFYGVPVPKDCPKLAAWYAYVADHAKVAAAPYPSEMLALARGLAEQSGYPM